MFSIHYKNWIKRNRDYLQQADDTIQENQLIPPDIVWLQASAWRSQAVYLKEYIEHNEDRDIYYPFTALQTQYAISTILQAIDLKIY